MRGQHYTRNTVEASAWCDKCGRNTPHRIDGVKKGPCLTCLGKLEVQHTKMQGVFCHLPRPANSKSVYQLGEMVTHLSASSLTQLLRYASLNRLPDVGIKKYRQSHGCELWVAIHVELAGEVMRRVVDDVSVEKLTTEKYLARLNEVNHLTQHVAKPFALKIDLNEQLGLPLTAPAGQVHRDE